MIKKPLRRFTLVDQIHHGRLKLDTQEVTDRSTVSKLNFLANQKA